MLFFSGHFKDQKVKKESSLLKTKPIAQRSKTIPSKVIDHTLVINATSASEQYRMHSAMNPT